MSDNTEKIYIAKVEEVIGKTGKTIFFARKAQEQKRISPGVVFRSRNKFSSPVSFDTENRLGHPSLNTGLVPSPSSMPFLGITLVWLGHRPIC